jgi:hypothetical protein
MVEDKGDRMMTWSRRVNGGSTKAGCLGVIEGA